MLLDPALDPRPHQLADHERNQQLDHDRLDRVPAAHVAVGVISTPTRTGVRKMPRRFEAEAAQTAAATLPRPIEVKAIDDCTVEGRQHRNSTPLDRVGDRTPDLLIRRPRAGNITKVKARIVRCRRQWVRLRDDGLARQLGAVQEEQHGDGDLDHPADDGRRPRRAQGRIEAGDHHAEQRGGC